MGIGEITAIGLEDIKYILNLVGENIEDWKDLRLQLVYSNDICRPSGSEERISLQMCRDRLKTVNINITGNIPIEGEKKVIKKKKGGNMSDCEHKFAHLDTIYKKEHYPGTYCTSYKRIDRFFCEKCLEEREKIKTKTINHNFEKAPDWWGKNN